MDDTKKKALIEAYNNLNYLCYSTEIVSVDFIGYKKALDIIGGKLFRHGITLEETEQL